MRCAAVIFAALFLAGCDPIASKRIAVSMPAPGSFAGSPATSRVQVETEEVDAAIRIVDGIVRQHGLSEDVGHRDQLKVLGWWGLSVEEARAKQRGSLTCKVYRNDQTLQVLFLEFGRLSSSADVKEMAEGIRGAFVARFGDQRVK
jgi:hypothetical protein